MATDWIVLTIKVDKRMKYGLKDSAICLICNVLKDCTQNVIIHPFICSSLIDWQGRQKGPSQKTYLNDQNSYRKKLQIAIGCTSYIGQVRCVLFPVPLYHLCIPSSTPAEQKHAEFELALVFGEM